MDYNFGVEWEFFSHYWGKDDFKEYILDNIPEDIVDDMTTCEYHDNRDFDVWQIQDDNSCEYELISPILRGESDLDKLKSVINTIIESEKASIDDRCGIHCHIAYDNGVDDLLGLLHVWYGIENIYRQLFPSYRHRSEYCQSFKGTAYSSLRKFHNAWWESEDDEEFITDGPRHTDINISNIYQLGTIEFRLLESTFCVDDICNFVRMNQAVIKAGILYAGAFENARSLSFEFPSFIKVETIDDFCKLLEIEKELEVWVRSRYEAFHADTVEALPQVTITRPKIRVNRNHEKIIEIMHGNQNNSRVIFTNIDS